MKTLPASRNHRAFSLVEMLICVAIISILTALVMGATQKLRRTADRTDGLSRMRQLSIAIQAFGADNDNSLPGPLWSGQYPWYNSGDTRTIGMQLWSYLGAPAPKSWSQELKAISFRAYERQRPSTGTHCLLVNQWVTVNNAQVAPWGYDSGGVVTAPLKFSLIASQDLSRTWAVQDVDKTSPNANKSASWYGTLPSKPIFDPFRLTLYFDWHAEAERIQ